jgi:hypothetical protein
MSDSNGGADFNAWEGWEKIEAEEAEREDVKQMEDEEMWEIVESAFWRDLEDEPEQIKTMQEEEKTYDVCLVVVDKEGKLLEFVPEEHKTDEMCRLALESSHGDVKVFDFFPKRIDEKTKQFMYLEATRKRIERLEKVVLRRLAIKESLKGRPRWRGATEEEINAKIAEIKSAHEQFLREHNTETEAGLQKFMDAFSAGDYMGLDGGARIIEELVSFFKQEYE